MSDDRVIPELRDFIAREFLNGKDEGFDAATPLIEWGDHRLDRDRDAARFRGGRASASRSPMRS